MYGTGRPLVLSQYEKNGKSPTGFTYNGQTLDDKSTVTLEMVTEYLKYPQTPLKIMAVNWASNNAFVYVHKLPVGETLPERDSVSFASAAAGDINADGHWQKTVTVGTTIADAMGVTDWMKTGVTATGYTLTGWYYVDEKGYQKGVDGTETIQGNLHLYPKWEANNYTLTFDAGEGGCISKTAPATIESTNQQKKYTVTYDQKIGTMRELVNGAAAETAVGKLPVAWKKGYVFKGWCYKENENATPIEITEKTVMKWENITISAVYEKAKVTFDLNGGTWAGAEPAATATAWDEALPGVVRTGTDGAYSYSIVSTTADEYTTNNVNYNANDYRRTLSRKGYTFTGWSIVDDAGNTTTDKQWHYPEYADVKLKATWTANSYTLTLDSLKSKAEALKFIWGTTTNPDLNGTNIKKISVTMDATIDAEDKWPKRDTWAINYIVGTGGGESNRLLLGLTFENVTRGDAGYTDNPTDKKISQCPNVGENTAYPEDIRLLTNSGLVLMNGSTFVLPASYPDLPTDSNITLFALYREISLVFVERYTDAAGVIHSKDLLATNYTEYVDPKDYRDVFDVGYYQHDPPTGNKTITDKGYAFKGWKINDGDTYYNASTYTEDKIDGYKTAAKRDGIYDIRLYTDYQPQVEMPKVVLTAANPTTQFQLPASMAEKGTYYWKLTQTTNTGTAKIIALDKITSHKHDASWTENTTTYTPDDTFSLTFTASKDGTPQTPIDLSLSGTSETGYTTVTNRLGNAHTVKFELGIANRVTTSTEYNFTLEITWDDKGAGQKVFVPICIKTVPPKYQVQFDANLPTGYGDLTMEPATYSEQQEYTYGAAYASFPTAPEVEGFTFDAWNTEQSGGDTTKVTADSLMTLYDENKKTAGTLYAQWTRNTHKLEVTDDLLAHWNVEWNPSYNAAAGDSGWQSFTTTATTADVPYRATVRLTPKDLDSKNLYPEFVTAENGWSLSDVTPAADGSYTFFMPNADKALNYSRTRTLDLTQGSIELAANGYTQGDQTVTWRGDYIIMQSNPDTATSNTLKVGKLADGASLALDKLNIQKKDSISIQEDCNITLNDDLTVKNIAVASGKNLTLQATGTSKPTLHLNAPANGTCGIGGDATLTLKNLTVKATVDSTTGQQYAGSLIKGSSVTLEDVVCTEQGLSTGGDGALVATTKLIDGATVTLTKSQIESKYPIYSTGTLNINDKSQVKAGGNDWGTHDLLQGTGVIHVTGGSTVDLGANAYGEARTLKLADAASRVYSTVYEYRDVAHGDISVDSAGYKQGSVSDKGRRLALLDENGGTPSCKVSVASAATIELVSNTVRLNQLVSTNGAAITLVGRGHSLTTTGDVRVNGSNGNLTLDGVTIKAQNVGVEDGTVLVKGAVTVNATTIGALGDVTGESTTTPNPNFTHVEFDDADAKLTYTGTLVRDWYRIAYDNSLTAFTLPDSRPTRLRTSEKTTASGAADVTKASTAAGGVDVAPATVSESYAQFSNWCYKANNEKTKLPLKNETTKTTTLDADLTKYAVENPGNDDRTLTLYIQTRPLNLTGSAKLTACEPAYTLTTGQTKTYTFSFAQSGGTDAYLLAGKTLYIQSVTPAAGITLDICQNVTTKAATAGSDYANSTFALAAQLSGNDSNGYPNKAKDLLPNSPHSLGTINPNGTLTITLHNANAITTSGVAGTITVVLSTDPNATDKSADTLTLTLTIEREASQIHVTVPLVLVVKTNIDGGSVNAGELETAGYGITNNSSMRVQLTEAKETRQDSTNNPLTTAAPGTANLSNAIDQYRVSFKQTDYKQAPADIRAKPATTTETTTETTTTETPNIYNPIQLIQISPLSFVTSPDPAKGIHFSTINYTVAIPTGDATTPSTTTP